MSQQRNLRRDDEPMEPLLTAKEMAALLQVHRKRLYRLVESGEAPPSIRIGNEIRFPPRDFRLWLESRKG